jgi:hypothetical protein
LVAVEIDWVLAYLAAGKAAHGDNHFGGIWDERVCRWLREVAGGAKAVVRLVGWLLVAVRRQFDLKTELEVSRRKSGRQMQGTIRLLIRPGKLPAISESKNNC